MISRGNRVAVISAAMALTLSGCSGASGPDTGSRSEPGAASSAASTSNGPSTGASASSSIAPPKPVTGKPGSVTVGASGDLIAHPNTVRMASSAAGGAGFAFDQFYAQVKPLVQAADVSLCQMESPVSADDTDLSRELSFNAPRSFAVAAKNAGFDGCSTANNHAWDRGFTGLSATRQVMHDVGLKAAGPGTSDAQDGQPTFYQAKGFTIAHLSYSYTLTNAIGNHFAYPPTAPWLRKNMWDVRKARGIESDAAAARAKGADLVLVSLHWGDEYRPVTDEQKTLAKSLMASGQVDWIIGNHPHIVQPCTKIDGRYVTYALGNFFSGQQATYLPGTADGAYASVTFTRDDAGKITQSMRFQPTYQDQRTRVIEPATSTKHPESYAKTVATMGAFGCDAKPM